MKNKHGANTVGELKAESGTYALVLRCSLDVTVRVGQLGPITFERGYYVYVGSAFGPGGVQARVSRHRRRRKKRHWHIDYLRPHLQLIEIWYTYDDDKREHDWAGLLNGSELESYTMGFGSSDCKCPSHLLYSKSRPAISRLKAAIQRKQIRHRRIRLLTVTKIRSF